MQYLILKTKELAVYVDDKVYKIIKNGIAVIVQPFDAMIAIDRAIENDNIEYLNVKLSFAIVKDI